MDFPWRSLTRRSLQVRGIHADGGVAAESAMACELYVRYMDLVGVQAARTVHVVILQVFGVVCVL